MYTLDLDKLKQAEVKLQELQAIPKMVFPLQWLIMCGWDKISYDEYLIKYTAGTLIEPQFVAFEIIYKNMLTILANIEYMTGINKFNYNYYKILLEQFAGSGLVSNKQQQTIQERVKKYRKQKQLENTSGLKIS